MIPTMSHPMAGIMALLVASLAEQGYSLEDFDGSEDNDEGL